MGIRGFWEVSIFSTFVRRSWELSWGVLEGLRKGKTNPRGCCRGHSREWPLVGKSPLPPPLRVLHPQCAYHSPRNFYKLIPLPVFFVCTLFFLNFYGNSLRRGYCTKSKQEWPDSGSTLEFFVIFTKLIPRRIFFVLQKVWC